MHEITQRITTTLAVCLGLTSAPVEAQETRAERIDTMRGLFEVSFGFGEIPEVRIEGDATLREEDEAALRRHMRREFRGNFHNRYHLFNIAVGYAW